MLIVFSGVTFSAKNTIPMLAFSGVPDAVTAREQCPVVDVRLEQRAEELGRFLDPRLPRELVANVGRELDIGQAAG